MWSNKKPKLSAAQTLALGFALIIVTGALLLTLPISSKNGQPIGFLDALFTATSATCVTGLVVFDTYLQFTLFGQIVILTLIQIGGLGFMTFAILFSMVLRKRIGLRERAFLMEAVSADRLSGVVRLARRVLLGTLVVEGTGAVLLSLRFCSMLGFGRGIWYGIFHAVSAFCNAGFDLFGYQAPYQSLVGFESDPLVLLTIAGLIIVGGIGFVVWEDVAVHRLDLRRYTLHTKVVLFTTAFLLAGSTALFYILEAEASFAGMSVPQRLLAAFFQAVTPRTAGFNAVDLTQLSESGALLTMLLMLVGASPGSTGGGMKLTTVAVMVMAVSAHLRRRSDVDLFSRRVEPETVRKAFCNALFPGRVYEVWIGPLLLCHGEDDGLYSVHGFFTFIHIHTGQLVSHTRHHGKNTSHTAHLFNLLHLGQKIIVIKFRLAQLLAQLLGLFLIHLGSRFLNQGLDIAHSQDSGSHSVRVELFQIRQLLAHTNI